MTFSDRRDDVSIKPGINIVSIGSRVERSTTALNKSNGVNANKGNDVSIKPGINIVNIGSRVKRGTKVINKGEGVSTDKRNDVSIKPGINIVSIDSSVKRSAPQIKKVKKDVDNGSIGRNLKKMSKGSENTDEPVNKSKDDS